MVLDMAGRSIAEVIDKFRQLHTELPAWPALHTGRARNCSGLFLAYAGCGAILDRTRLSDL